MMHGRKENSLIIIEKGQLSSYPLDNRAIWEVGRLSKENIPDIQLSCPTVSRKHGKFQNMDGVWFYLDYNGKNGTVYNHKHIETGLNGRIKPIMLKDGDVFVFGGGPEEVISHKTIWGIFLERGFDDSWRTADSKGFTQLSFRSEGKETVLLEPSKGTVLEKDTGIAIYMGELTYLIGDMTMSGS